MIHVVYLSIITLLVAAGGYLIWELKKRLDHEKFKSNAYVRMAKMHREKALELQALKAETEQALDGLRSMHSDLLINYNSEIAALKYKLQSAYGRIGKLTQQVERLKNDEPTPVKDEVPPNISAE